MLLISWDTAAAVFRGGDSAVTPVHGHAGRRRGQGVVMVKLKVYTFVCFTSGPVSCTVDVAV